MKVPEKPRKNGLKFLGKASSYEVVIRPFVSRLRGNLPESRIQSVSFHNLRGWNSSSQDGVDISPYCRRKIEISDYLSKLD